MSGRRARSFVPALRQSIWLASIALALSACGIHADDSPEVLSPSEIARAGATAAAKPTPTATDPSAATVTQQVDLFFVRGDRLADIKRTVRSAVPAPALAALLAGPTREEAAAGIRSAIPAATQALEVTVVAGIAVVTVPRAFEQLSAPDQILAVAQLVFTLTSIEGVEGMQMTADDQIVAVPTTRGRLSAGPVSPADYASLAPA